MKLSRNSAKDISHGLDLDSETKFTLLIDPSKYIMKIANKLGFNEKIKRKALELMELIELDDENII